MSITVPRAESEEMPEAGSPILRMTMNGRPLNDADTASTPGFLPSPSLGRAGQSAFESGPVPVNPANGGNHAASY